MTSPIYQARGMNGDLEERVRQYATGLQARGFWVSPEADWKLWRVHVDGAAAILGCKTKTLQNARSDPSNLHFRLRYIPSRSGVQYLISDVVIHEAKLRLDDAA
jgi:hypothetical protein